MKHGLFWLRIEFVFHSSLMVTILDFLSEVSLTPISAPVAMT